MYNHDYYNYDSYRSMYVKTTILLYHNSSCSRRPIYYISLSHISPFFVTAPNITLFIVTTPQCNNSTLTPYTWYVHTRPRCIPDDRLWSATGLTVIFSKSVLVDNSTCNRTSTCHVVFSDLRQGFDQAQPLDWDSKDGDKESVVNRRTQGKLQH